jgi:hypothetical protein
MAQGVSPQEATEIATDAYVYGYSLVTTEVTRVQMSNVPKIETLSAPMNAAPRTGASLGEGAERRCGPDPPQRSERPGSARGVTA